MFTRATATRRRLIQVAEAMAPEEFHRVPTVDGLVFIWLHLLDNNDGDDDNDDEVETMDESD